MSEPLPTNQNLNNSQTTLLINHVGFYRSLSDKGKVIFHQRVNKFIGKKDWSFNFDPGNDGFILKTLVAASCIEITWGIKDKFISSYKSIFLDLDGIKLREAKDSGKTLWLSGNIEIPYKKIKEGYVVPDSNRYVGLYEWARALVVVAKRNNTLDDFFSAYYKTWSNTAMNLLEANDEADAMAETVNQLFNQPAELKSKYPELYEQTKRLLNLDLLEAKEFDFVYSEKIRAEKKIKSRNRALLFGVQKDIRNHGVSSSLLYGILIQVPFFVGIWGALGRQTYSSWIFFGIFAGICIPSIAFIYWFYYTKRGLSVKSSLLLIFLGLMPFVYSFMIVINSSITLKKNIHYLHVKEIGDLYHHIPWAPANNLWFSRLTLHRTNKETNQVDVQSYSSYSDFGHYLNDLNDQDDVELHTRTGIFGAEIYKSFEVTMYYQ